MVSEMVYIGVLFFWEELFYVQTVVNGLDCWELSLRPLLSKSISLDRHGLTISEGFL